MAVFRDPGPSKSQSLTFEAWGNAEDISPIIINITPDKTPFLSSMAQDKAYATAYSWATEELAPPQMNAHLEKEDYGTQKVGSVGSLSNNIQIFHTTGWVSDVQKNVRKVYNEQNELSRQITNKLIEHARDIEYAIVNGDKKREGTETVAALTGGIPYFLQSATVACTVSSTDGTVTTSAPHGLTTGNFIYFNAKTMPTGLKKNTLYYVRLDDTTPDTKFTLFSTLKGAAENIVAAKVTPSTSGTDVTIEKNNIVDLEGSASFDIAHINKVMEMCYYRGGSPTTLWMNPANKARFSDLVTALGTTNRKSGDKKMNTVATTLETDFGEVVARPHLLYPSDRIDAVDDQYLSWKWLQPTHKVSDLPKNGNYSQFVIESSGGLKFGQPLSSGAIVNVKVG